MYYYLFIVLLRKYRKIKLSQYINIYIHTIGSNALKQIIRFLFEKCQVVILYMQKYKRFIYLSIIKLFYFHAILIQYLMEENYKFNQLFFNCDRDKFYIPIM